jgi:hypothetical protein
MSELLSPQNRVLPRIGESVLRSLVSLTAVAILAMPGFFFYEFYLAQFTGYPQGVSLLGLIGMSAFISAKLADFLRLPQEEREEIVEEENGPDLVNTVLSILFYSTAMVFGAVIAFEAAAIGPGWLAFAIAAFYPLADVWVGSKLVSPSLIVVGAMGLVAYGGYRLAQLLVDARSLLAREIPEVPGFAGVALLIRQNPAIRIRQFQRRP